MGEVYRHHITMLVSDEQEDAIRFLFKENKWKCWMKALSDETVTEVMENGLADIFSDSCDEVEENGCNVSTDVADNDLDHTEINCTDQDDNAAADDDEIEIDTKTDVVLDDVNDKNNVPDSQVKEESVDTVIAVKQTKKSHNKKKSDHKKNKRNNAEEKGKVKCSFCDIYVVNQYILKRHCQRRHKDVWFEFECKDCPSRFKTKEKLWQHRNEVNHKPPENNPKREQKKHHTPEELAGMGHVKCNACDRYYPNNRLLRRHLYSVHRDLLPKWNCPICNVEYETREELWTHKRETKHNTSIWTLGHYQCDSCGKIFNRYDSFRLHKKVACGKEKKELEELRVHPCDVCGMSFKSMHHVKAHKRGVHLNAPEICHICGAVCKNKRALGSHQKRHDLTNRKYSCGECDKSFFNSAVLKQHMRTHTKEKPYKCPMCTYTCAVKQNVHKHSLKIHKVQVQAIDLRNGKDQGGAEDDDYSKHQASGQLEKNQGIDDSFQNSESHDNFHDGNLSLHEDHKMVMKMPPPINNMVLPPSSTSYLEMMNYNIHPTDYNAQPNIPIDPAQYQY